jgi:hypothetical protein
VCVLIYNLSLLGYCKLHGPHVRYTYMYVYVYVYVCIYTQPIVARLSVVAHPRTPCVNTLIHTHRLIHAHTHTKSGVFKKNIRVYNICVRLSILNFPIGTNSRICYCLSLDVYTCTHQCTCIHVHTNAHIYMYTLMYHQCICIHVHTNGHFETYSVLYV